MITVADIAEAHDIRGLEADLEKLKNNPEDRKAKIGNGSTFIAMDTGNVYIYDIENDDWILLG